MTIFTAAERRRLLLERAAYHDALARQLRRLVCLLDEETVVSMDHDLGERYRLGAEFTPNGCARVAEEVADTFGQQLPPRT